MGVVQVKQGMMVQVGVGELMGVAQVIEFHQSDFLLQFQFQSLFQF